VACAFDVSTRGKGDVALLRMSAAPGSSIMVEVGGSVRGWGGWGGWGVCVCVCVQAAVHVACGPVKRRAAEVQA
jgi:hypothetical protein